jgi:radical SAM superfamily enzyme YgiQ (UPF0313 family)
MAMRRVSEFATTLLCVVPPYAVTVPPAGPAALLGYLRSFGIHDVDFLDLRLYVPDSYATTYSATSVWGDALAIDVPDLPIVLRLLDAFDRGSAFWDQDDPLLSAYCLERAINPSYLRTYLGFLDRFFETTFAQLPHLELVGFSTWNSNYLTTLMAARHLKRRGRPPLVVVGGPQVTESAAAARLGLASRLFDIVVQGEGEEAFRLIYEQVQRTGTLSIAEPVPGTLMYDHQEDKVVLGGKRALLRMANLPLPDFSRFDLPAYQKGNGHRRVLPFQLSRGCTDKCAFCTEWRFWEKYRPGDVDQTLDQLDELKTRYRADGFAFTDSLLNGVVGRLHQFTEGMVRRKLDLKWGGYMRANMSSELESLLKRAGFVLAFIGVESLADDTLAAMNKRMTEAQNLAALEAFLSNGVAVRAGFIPGFPGDSRENFMRTASTFGRLQQKYPSLLALGIEPFVVSPGQLWYDNLAEQGLVAAGWEDRYLDIASRYRHITEKVLCRIDGNNQGAERTGRYRIAVAISQLGSNPGQTVGRRESIREADFMYYSYEPEETDSASELRFRIVGRDWFLATFKTDHGTVHGYLMTAAEKDAFETLRGSDRLARPWATGTSLAETEELWSFLQQVTAAHIVRMSAGAPILRALTTTAAPLDDDQIVALSSFTIARADELTPGATVTMLHVVNGRTEVVSSTTGAAIADLARGPRSVGSLRGQIAGSGTSDLAALERLRENGMLVVLRTEVDAASPGGHDARFMDRTCELGAPPQPVADPPVVRRLPLIL